MDGRTVDLQKLEEICLHRRDNVAFLTEACRWVCEYFDRHCSSDQGSAMFNVPPLSHIFLQLLSSHLGNSKVKIKDQQMFAKTMGVLALHEQNRATLADVQALARVVGLLRNVENAQNPLDHIHIIGCCLWALVILCRPLGGIEGEALSSFARENFRNVKQLSNIGGVMAVMEMIRRYPNEPELLAKAFWLLVNLALVEDVKMFLIQQNVIADIIGTMKRYPDHKRLNFRATFALINMGIRTRAKLQIRELEGHKIILAVMKKWSKCPLIQKCCCNVIRSLMVGDLTNTARLIEGAGGIPLIQNILTEFSDNNNDHDNNGSPTSLWGMANQLIYLLQNYRNL